MTRRTAGRPTRRAIRGAGLVVAAAVAGAGSIAVAALVAGSSPGDAWQIGPVLGAAAAGALIWPLARRRVDAVAERLVHGGRRSPDSVVRWFEAASGQDIPLADLLDQLAADLAQGFGAQVAEVWRVEEGDLVRRASVPDDRPIRLELGEAASRVLAGSGVMGRAWVELWLPDLLEAHAGRSVRVAPASHGGVALGLVLVGRDAGAEPFGGADDLAMAELGRRLGVILRNRQLDATLRATLEDLRDTNEELRASRVRLVTTADAERRRIERDLHDGAQQHLVALAVNLRLADDAIAEDPAVAHEVLEALGQDVRAAVAELRLLAHGIFPPLLVDAGLLEALHVVGQRAASSVSITGESVGRYAPETEAAVYFCCVEAVQNAAKHAPGAAVSVHLDESDGMIRFTVDDDGPGLGAATGSGGHGLSNMNDRVGALGGTLVLGVSPSGGTRIAGAIPIVAESAS